jgi:proline-specific peptidase
MANPAAIEKTGLIPFKYGGEMFQTFYKTYGDIENRTKDPLIVLHGGPGLVHDAYVPFSDLSVDSSIPVILYDQIGNGHSTHLKEKPSTFWTIDLFIDELANLINFFGIQNGFSIVGHSWGGILGSEYEVRHQPPGLKKLILTNSLAASSLWNQSNMQLMQKFSPEVQEGLKAGMKEPAKFHAALLKLHKAHGCILPEFPEPYSYTLDQVFGEKGDPTVALAPYAHPLLLPALIN